MTRRLRVVRVIDRLNVGGPSKHVTWLATGLEAHGIDTTLVTGTIAPGEGDMSWFAHASGVRPVVLPGMRRALGPADVAVTWRLWRELVRLRPDVVHTHKAKAGAVGRAAAWLYRWMAPGTLLGRPRRVRVVHTFHGHTFHGYHGRLATRAFLCIERLLAAAATDCVVTLSPQQRDEIVGRYGVGCRERTVVVPLGLDTATAAAAPGALRRALGVRPDVFLVGVVGRLCEVKNHVLLLDAVARLRRQRLPLRLAVVGDGHLRAPLEAYAAARGLRDVVHFLGFRDDVATLYPDMDVVALSSVNEGTPLTLLEGMAAGRAVAATAVGGVTDIMGARAGTPCPGVAQWAHGLTAPSGDVDAFAGALRHLAEAPGERARMGARGAAFVRERMSVERLVADVAGLYRTLVETTGRGSG